MSDRILHCWRDYRDWVEQTYGYLSEAWIESWAGDNATCLLPDGHEGPHVWTPDSDITVQFTKDPA